MKLAISIAEDGYRPPLRETWSSGVNFLIGSCWSHNQKLRPDLGQVMKSLKHILQGDHELIMSSEVPNLTSDVLSATGKLHLAPGALWRRVETPPSKIVLGKVLGEGTSSKVHLCTFRDAKAACKIFRNTSEESAFKEIEITFALRHPNVIGLYAWFQLKGEAGFSMLWPTACIDCSMLHFQYLRSIDRRNAHADGYGHRVGGRHVGGSLQRDKRGKVHVPTGAPDHPGSGQRIGAHAPYADADHPPRRQVDERVGQRRRRNAGGQDRRLRELIAKQQSEREKLNRKARGRLTRASFVRACSLFHLSFHS